METEQLESRKEGAAVIIAKTGKSPYSVGYALHRGTSHALSAKKKGIRATSLTRGQREGWEVRERSPEV